MGAAQGKGVEDVEKIKTCYLDAYVYNQYDSSKVNMHPINKKE